MQMSQKTKILNLLIDREWVCNTELMAAYIPDYRRRLVDLKQDGYILSGRPCQQHDHKSKNLKEWHLISSPQSRPIIEAAYFYPTPDEILTKAQINPTEAFYKNLKQGSLLS